MDLEEHVSLSDDITNDPVVVGKIIHDRIYAQNLYAALCNIIWYKETEFLPVLTGNNEWSCSWRWAGGFVAGLGKRDEDYLDYYCSGIRDADHDGDEMGDEGRTFANEGQVKEEIENDLKRLGWKWKYYEDQGI
jgi:hypothetical protein